MRIDRVKFTTELARRDMKIVELAKIVGISRTTLSNIKRGCSCSEKNIEKIANALNVKVESIIE